MGATPKTKAKATAKPSAKATTKAAKTKSKPATKAASQGISGKVVHIDSLTASEFEVHVDDVKATGIFRVSDFVSFHLDVHSNTRNLVAHPFRISKMVQSDPDNPFNKWLRDTRAAGEAAARPMRTLTLLAVDDGDIIRRWTLHKAWISAVSYSEFNSGGGDLVEEVITIHYDKLDEAFN
jgi:hypothetical protein